MSEKIKVLLVSFIVLFGAAFAIMSFNEDVAVTDLFDRLYQIVLGEGAESNGILEFTYALGVSSGIIVFFNHFGSKKIKDDPTPLQIKMWQYQQDVTEYEKSESGESE